MEESGAQEPGQDGAQVPAVPVTGSEITPQPNGGFSVQNGGISGKTHSEGNIGDGVGTGQDGEVILAGDGRWSDGSEGHSEDLVRGEDVGGDNPNIGTHLVPCDVDDNDLCGNRENPDAEEGEEEEGVHNRSHESIESRRTIIEADDFASFLAQEDEDDDLDDFKDEDVDFDINDNEDGGVDLSVLMKAGNNPYMLDFTAGMLADSEVEGDDDTLSDPDIDQDDLTPREGSGTTQNDGVNRTPATKRDPSYRKTQTWVRQTTNFLQHQQPDEERQREEEEDDEEMDSPPRNLREEINNNVGKFAGVLPPMGSALFSTYPGPDRDGYPHPAPQSTPTPAGLPALSKYLITSTSNSTVPPPPILPSKLSNPFQTTSTPTSHKSLPPEFNPDLQSSPKLGRANHPRHHQQHELNQTTHADDLHLDRGHRSKGHPGHQPHLSPEMSAVLSPRYSREDHPQRFNPADRPASPSSTVPPHLQTYAFETPHRGSAHYSFSMENLSSSPVTPFPAFLDAPPTSDSMIEGYVNEGFTLQRRNSLPNIASLVAGPQPGVCQNCNFSRNDYLFKIRLLQTQLEKTERELKKKEKQWAADLGELRKETDRQQKIITQSLTLGPEAKIEATMQHEITRLTSENLDLRESIDKQTDQIRKLKKMLKVYAKKLKDGEGWPDKWSWVRPSMSVSSELAAEIAAELENQDDGRSTEAIATVIHRERTYMGMLEYKKEDEGALIKHLILDLKPKVAAGLIPGLPSYILFMCVRHTDYINDDDKVKSLLTSTINGIKKVVKRHSDDLERITLWLANTCRLLHTLKQYSGEKQFQAENTSKQNEESLRNFDLSEYRQVFSDLAVWNYQALMKLMEELIQPNIVPAILEHEAIAGLTASKPSGLRGRASSNAKDLEDGKDSQHSLDALMRTLNSYMRIVKQHAVDPELVKQIFRQLFYFLCAGALNNLLLRKDMCNWSKGMQIRYNLSHLEQWLRDNSLHEFGAQAALEPIIQASQLLQARKTDSDVDSVCDMCSRLTTAQIVKILNIYTPVDEFEERVPIAFIRKIQAKLKQRDGADNKTANTLLMDTKYSYPVTFPFNPSSVALETLAVPEQLHLGFLLRH